MPISVLDRLFSAMVREDFEECRSLLDTEENPDIPKNIIEHHRLAPVIGNLVDSSTRLDFLPAWLSDACRKQHTRQVAVDVLYSNEVAQLLDSLAPDTTLLIMKGMGLSHSTYPEPGIRSMADIDILVDKRDLETVIQAFKRLGYDHCRYDEITTKQLSFSKTLPNKLSVVFDVHWRSNNRPLLYDTLDIKKSAPNSEALSDIHPRAHTPGKIDALLFACAHRAGERAFAEDEDLLWLYDIHLLINRMDQQDFDDWLKLAAAKQLCSICHNAITACVKWFATQIPDDVLMYLENNRNNEPSARLLKPGAARFRTSELFTHRSLLTVFTDILELAFPPVAFMQLQYESSNTPMLMYAYLKRITQGLMRGIQGTS